MHTYRPEKIFISGCVVIILVFIVFMVNTVIDTNKIVNEYKEKMHKVGVIVEMKTNKKIGQIVEAYPEVYGKFEPLYTVRFVDNYGKVYTVERVRQFEIEVKE